MTLIDTKTEPRHVQLGEAVRELLDGFAGPVSGAWVFPSRSGDEPLGKNELHYFWTMVHDVAGIVADVRRYDRRHEHASIAVMNGESLHMTRSLLEHWRASTTNRYVYLDGATLRQTEERVAKAVESRLQRMVDA